MALLEQKNYRNPCKHVEGDKRTGTTRKNACNRETMVKIRLAIIFIIAQVVLTKYTSSRFRSRIVEDRAIRYNRNIEANCLSNTVLGRLKDLKEVSYALNTQLRKCRALKEDFFDIIKVQKWIKLGFSVANY